MAEKKPEGGEGEQPAPPKKNTKLLIIIGAVVLVLVLVGGSAAFFLTKKKADATEEDTGDEPAKEEKAHKAKKDHEVPPVFVKIEPFTVKLQSDGQDAYLQATPELKVLEAPVSEKVKQYMPEIRHHVLLILAAKKPSDVATPQGVQQLSNEIRDDINGIIGEVRRKPKTGATGPAEKAGPDDPVQAVMFTSFIVQ